MSALSNRYPGAGSARGNRSAARPVGRVFGPANTNVPNAPRPRLSFPGRRAFPGVPFGKRVPNVGWAGPARLPKVPGWLPYVKYGVRLVPAVQLGFTAWELYNWYTPTALPGISPADYGFTLCCRVGPPPYTAARYNEAWNITHCVNQELFCGLTGQVPNEYFPFRDNYGAQIWRGYGYLNGARMSFQEYWTRPGYENGQWPQYPPMPEFVPWRDPLVVPQPYPYPQEVVPLPHPFAPPLGPAARPMPWPRNVPRPPRLPEDRDSREPRSRPRPQYNPNPRRPRDGEKEPPKRKANPPTFERIRRGLGKAVGMGSEAYDLLDNLYEAIPEKIRGKEKRNLAEKIDFLFEHGDKIDMAEFWNNYTKNEAHDRVWGEAFGNVGNLDQGGSPTAIKL